MEWRGMAYFGVYFSPAYRADIPYCMSYVSFLNLRSLGYYTFVRSMIFKNIHQIWTEFEFDLSNTIDPSLFHNWQKFNADTYVKLTGLGIRDILIVNSQKYSIRHMFIQNITTSMRMENNPIQFRHNRRQKIYHHFSHGLDCVVAHSSASMLALL